MNSEVAPIIGVYHKYVGLFKAHERLIIILAFIVFVLFGGSKVLTYWEHHDQLVYDKDKAALLADKDKAAAEAKSNAIIAQQYNDLARAVLAENTKLEQAIAARDQATRQQQVKDQTLPPSDLALRWEQLENLPLGSVNPAPGNLFTLTDPAARTTVQSLEEVPQLKADITAVRAESAGKDQQIAKSEERATGLQVEVNTLVQTGKDADKVCKAEVALVKAQARKSKLKIGLAFYIAGLLTKPIAVALGL